VNVSRASFAEMESVKTYKDNGYFWWCHDEYQVSESNRDWDLMMRYEFLTAHIYVPSMVSREREAYSAMGFWRYRRRADPQKQYAIQGQKIT